MRKKQGQGKAFDVGYASDRGQRQRQEDNFGVRQYADGSLLAVLADGIGGYAGGAVASEIAVRLFGEYFPLTEGPIQKRLETTLQRTNQKLVAQASANRELHSMGTTLLAVYAQKNELHWISVGDSLLYHFTRRGHLQQLNKLHTVKEHSRHLLAAGSISQREYDAVEDPHTLTSALGAGKLHEIDCQSSRLGQGELLILASDGLMTLNTADIQTVLKPTQTSQTLADTLVNSVLARKLGNQDNVSVLVIKKDARRYFGGGLFPSVVGVSLLFGSVGGGAYLFNTMQSRNEATLATNQELRQQIREVRQQQQKAEAALKATQEEAVKQKAAEEAKPKATSESNKQGTTKVDQSAQNRKELNKNYSKNKLKSKNNRKTPNSKEKALPSLPRTPDNIYQNKKNNIFIPAQPPISIPHVPGLPELPLPPLPNQESSTLKVQQQFSDKEI